jgi:hypothetical protein
MTIEAALYTQLSTFAGLTAIVGAAIYPMQADQSAVLPYVTFHLISDVPENVMAALPTLTRDRFQFSAWAVTYLQASQIAAQVTSALQSFTGMMGGAGGVTVSACLKELEVDMYEGDSKTYQRITDFIIFHNAV